MTYLSIIEKIKILFDLLMDFEFVLIFTLVMLYLTFLYSVKKLSGKKYISYILLTFIIVFGISIVNNYEVLSNTFDNFTTIFFENIYFPSIYVYIGVLIISFIAFVVSLFNVMLKKIYKIINVMMFTLNNILFVIILNIIAKNNIDVFSPNSLYTNTNLVAILELSMGLCLIWFLSLLVVYTTDVICVRLANKKVCNKEEKFSTVLEVNSDIVNNVNVQNDEEYIYENISSNTLDSELEEISNNCEDIIFSEIKAEKELLIEENSIVNNEEITVSNKEITFNDILNGCIPVTYYDNSKVLEEYNLINPQNMYENNYNKIKEEIVFNDLNNYKENIAIVEQNEEKQDNIINNYNIDRELSVEELTLKEKIKASEERLIINTVSLNDLIDEEFNEIMENTKEENNFNKVENIKETKEYNYSIDDYKKIYNMLNSLKEYSTNNNIKIDDAVAISLISNYSIDDCLKFKNILESNLN